MQIPLHVTFKVIGASTQDPTTLTVSRAEGATLEVKVSGPEGRDIADEIRRVIAAFYKKTMKVEISQHSADDTATDGHWIGTFKDQTTGAVLGIEAISEKLDLILNRLIQSSSGKSIAEWQQAAAPAPTLTGALEIAATGKGPVSFDDPTQLRNELSEAIKATTGQSAPFPILDKVADTLFKQGAAPSSATPIQETVAERGDVSFASPAALSAALLAAVSRHMGSNPPLVASIAAKLFDIAATRGRQR